MSGNDVFDVPARDRITDVRSYSYMPGWQNPLTPEQHARFLESSRKWQHEIMLQRIRNKERNMMNRLERRRAAIRGKWLERGKAALVVLGLMVVVPLAGTVIALSWNALWRVTL